MILPPPYKKSHGLPCEIPDEIMKQPPLERQNRKGDTEMKCTNWGCNKEFMGDRNDKKVCLHHPGRFEFGSE
jgi:hypothetical protein